MNSVARRRQGLIDRLLSVVDVLPGSAAAWFVSFSVGLLVVAHLIVWLSGATPFGQPEPEVIPPILGVAYFGWFLHRLNDVASSAFDDFRPALGVDQAQQERFRFELTSIPDRLGLTAIVLVELVVNVVYFGTVRPLRPPLPPQVEVLSSVVWAVTAALLGILILHTIRQMRLVSRLSALARNVDVFKPAATNAFSRLTAFSAVGIMVFVTLVMLSSREQSLAFIAQGALVLGLAVASFVLPLRVMHARLETEKTVLLDEVQDRLKLTLSRIHASVDQNDLAHADQLHESLATVLAERDVLARLATWPWSTATFRGIASALLLPIVVFVITRVIDQLL